LKITYLIPKTRKRVVCLFKYERKYLLNHFFIFNYQLPYALRQQISLLLKSVKRYDRFTEAKIRCPLTNSSKVYNIRFGLSR